MQRAWRRALGRCIRLAFGGMTVVAAVGCAGGDAAPPETVASETPADRILGVGTVWRAAYEMKGFGDKEVDIAVFVRKIESTIYLGGNRDRRLREVLAVEEIFDLQSGQRFECKARGQAPLVARFGWKQGEAAVELRRDAATLDRTCKPSGFPNRTLTLPAAPARFMLKSDQLVAFEPPLEKRIYFPVE